MHRALNVSRRRFARAALAIGAAAATAHPSLGRAATQYDVTARGATAYVIGGSSNPALTLTRGQTYIFNVLASGHPFWIATLASADNTASYAFNEGVTGNGSSPGTVTFIVPASAPDTLFYQCQFHGSMTGTLNIVDPVGARPVPAMSPAMLGVLGVGLASVAEMMRRRRASRRGSTEGKQRTLL